MNEEDYTTGIQRSANPSRGSGRHSSINIGSSVLMQPQAQSYTRNRATGLGSRYSSLSQERSGKKKTYQQRVRGSINGNYERVNLDTADVRVNQSVHLPKIKKNAANMSREQYTLGGKDLSAQKYKKVSAMTPQKDVYGMRRKVSQASQNAYSSNSKTLVHNTAF